LSLGELASDSTTALLVAEAIAISLNENQPMLAIAKKLDISLAFLSELGRTGLAQKAKYQLAKPVPPSSLDLARRLLIIRHLRNKNFLVKLSSLMNFANLK
jgi:hypothetical protein